MLNDRTWLLFTAAAFARDKWIRREVERVIEDEREHDERAARLTATFDACHAITSDARHAVTADERSTCSCHSAP